ncbi:hypothetical protein AB0M39_38085 [Streptomyces sp. NPDC051907]|uniref:hypothetical protein n=1 Tax=Streptomyces sp. NPDC051907 TaxID=3155284 RepID=UPI00344AA525
MFDLYAVQAAAAPGEGRLTFEGEGGETESLHLGSHPTAAAALLALLQAHADRATRPSYADPGVQPPLWGHEVYHRPDGGRAACVARADGTGVTVATGFALANAGDVPLRLEAGTTLEPRWQ